MTGVRGCGVTGLSRGVRRVQKHRRLNAGAASTLPGRHWATIWPRREMPAHTLAEIHGVVSITPSPSGQRGYPQQGGKRKSYGHKGLLHLPIIRPLHGPAWAGHAPLLMLATFWKLRDMAHRWLKAGPASETPDRLSTSDKPGVELPR